MRHLLFLSILCSLVLFTNCGDSDDPVADTPTNTTDDSTDDDSTTVLDADGDGVADAEDTCADTPSGETVDSSGCSDSQKDTDADGLADHLDTCADTPSGETVDENGCSDSQKDTDGDGVSDDLDTCADTTEGVTVDENGCADSQIATVWTGDVINFTKADDADPTLATNQDRITNQVWITRDNGEGGQIYNRVLENASDKETSPQGTAWSEGDLDDYASLTYVPFRTATGKPKDAIGKTYVVHLTEDNIYLSVKLTSWSGGKAGGFSYERSTE